MSYAKEDNPKAQEQIIPTQKQPWEKKSPLEVITIIVKEGKDYCTNHTTYNSGF